MERKRFFMRLASIIMVVALCFGVFSGVAIADSTTLALRGNQNYVGNQGSLIEAPFVALPPGAVKARDWLENQLLLAKNGLTGHMRDFNEYNSATSQWLGASSGENWERGPYYLRGLVSLAYVLDDDDLIAEAQKWIDAIISRQNTSTGYFGPSDNSWWSRMPVLMAMRDYYEATEARGAADSRVLTFMERYFRYQQSELPSRRLSNWADARGGDNIDSVYWLYNRLYDQDNPSDTAWLLSLGTLLKDQTNDWITWYNDTTVRQHVVNTSQGSKLPAVYYQFAQDQRSYTALQNGLLNIGIDHGRIDGLPNSDEAARDNRSTRGTETCSIVEGLLSSEISMRILGEPWIGDYIERIAYNALPAAITPDSTGHTYYVLQNQVMATLGNHGFDCDHGDSSAFGAPLGFDCCFSNYHMGWPKFVQNMWMATDNDGLAIISYGPNSVTAKVADGKQAQFLQETDYPFKDDVKLTYLGDNAEFELQLRIPSWASGASVKVDGKPQIGVETDSFFVVEREWKYGDVVEINFPSKIETSTWYNDSVAVNKGALIFGLKIDEDWRTTKSNAARELKVTSKDEFPLREVFAASPWNYGLVVDYDNVASSFEVDVMDEMPPQPFNSQSAPVTLKAKGQLLPDWVLNGNIAGPQPFGPTKYNAAMVQDIELIPYGSGRLRITHFPKIGDAQDTIIRTTARDGKIITHNGVKTLEFKNIVVPAANDYTLTVKGSGAGNVIINARSTSAINLSSGTVTITGLKTRLTGNFQFTANQYNNIRFTGDVNVESIEVAPVSRTIESINVTSSSRTDDAIRITTNLNWQETSFKVVYGTESGVYTNTVRNLQGGTAAITGIDKKVKYYARVIASIKGVEVQSDELVFESSVTGGGLKPNPNVPAAVYNGFNSLNYMQQDWRLYDPNNKIQIADAAGTGTPQIIIGKDPQVKAALETQDAYTWVDYVVEAEISVDVADTNNCGIMFRTTNVGNGSDAYNGYFFGIGHLGVNQIDGETRRYDGPGLMLGYADGSWHDLDPLSLATVVPNQKYKLKVVAYGDMFALYLDGELIKTFTDSKFAVGTVGLRSYNEAFKAYNLTVRPVLEDDLTVFETGLQPDPNAADARYAGFGTVSDVTAAWTKYPSTAPITYVDDNGKARMDFARNTQVKAMLTTPTSSTNPDTWTDYVAEAKLSVDLVNNNNCGFMLRTTGVGNGSDAYNGLFVGIGWLGVNTIDGVQERYDGPGIMVGYADGSWHDLYPMRYAIAANQIYTLKVVAYGDKLAIYLDDVFVRTITDSRFAAGGVGLRSYNEAFKVYDVTVRNVVKADLAVFEESEEPEPEPEPDPPDYNNPNFTNSFNTTTWTRVGSSVNTNITINSSGISFASNTNLKAYAGNTSWTDYVYEADITLGTGTGNAGIIFRSSNETSGADNYYGYYFGLYSNGNYEIGRARNNWTFIQGGNVELKDKNRLKVICYNSHFLFYINDELVHFMVDSNHTAGRIGLRTYNKAFSCDYVNVRPLTPAEFDLIKKPVVIPTDITGESCYNAIQLTYPRIAQATTYKALYGTAPGVYTGEVNDITFNSYKGGGIFSADKVAFTVPAAGVYYVKFIPLNGTASLVESEEIEVATGFVKDVTEDKTVLAQAIAAADLVDASTFTEASLKRLDAALQFADEVYTDPDSNQMSVNLAIKLLNSAIITSESEAPIIVYEPISIVRDGDDASAAFTIWNFDSADITLQCIVAVYDATGRLKSVSMEEYTFEAYSNTVVNVSQPMENGWTAKAFIWNLNSAPMFDAATLK